MLALESSRWAELKASPGGNGELTRQLLTDARAGDASAFDELLHQVCHQLTPGDVAYAAVPHLVSMAESASVSDRVRALTIVGWVVAASSRAAPPVPQDLEPAYQQSHAPALALSLRTLEEPSLDRNDVLDLLGIVAALRGNGEVAIHLFFHDGAANLSCPECGEYVAFTKE